jgi:hypothetical protein
MRNLLHTRSSVYSVATVVKVYSRVLGCNMNPHSQSILITRVNFNSLTCSYSFFTVLAATYCDTDKQATIYWEKYRHVCLLIINQNIQNKICNREVLCWYNCMWTPKKLVVFIKIHLLLTPPAYDCLQMTFVVPCKPSAWTCRKHVTWSLSTVV